MGARLLRLRLRVHRALRSGVAPPDASRPGLRPGGDPCGAAARRFAAEATHAVTEEEESVSKPQLSVVRLTVG